MLRFGAGRYFILKGVAYYVLFQFSRWKFQGARSLHCLGRARNFETSLE